MNSGLYTFAGDSATATEAAYAKRLDELTTKASNVYSELSRSSSMRPRWPGVDAYTTSPTCTPAGVNRTGGSRQGLRQRSDHEAGTLEVEGAEPGSVDGILTVGFGAFQ